MPPPLPSFSSLSLLRRPWGTNLATVIKPLMFPYTCTYYIFYYWEEKGMGAISYARD